MPPAAALATALEAILATSWVERRGVFGRSVMGELECWW